MAEIIRMPRMSDTMTEGTLVNWVVKIGDSISPGDLIAEVETDKATMELESYQEGVLLHIGVEEGQAVPVNGIIAILGEKGEDVSAILKEEESKAAEPQPQAQAVEEKVVEEKKEIIQAVKQIETTPQPAMPNPVNENVQSKRIKASPLAKKLAAENNVDLNHVKGSGDDGRIVKKDIEAFLASPAATNQKSASPSLQLPAFTGEEAFEDVPNSQMRKTIARRLAESKFGAPHFYLRMTIEMDNLMAARKQLNAVSPVKISFNDIIIKAAAMALRKHPAVNAGWMDDVIRYNKHIHVGMAVAVDEGLMVPVIKFADNKSLSHIAVESKDLAGRARERKLGLDEMQGNTFSISNLGMMDIDDFTAIINPPNSCILAIGKIQQVPVVKNGEIAIANTMAVTMSCDHRVVDGAVGAAFLQSLKSFIENPIGMLA